MKLSIDDYGLNPTERANADKWMAKHSATCTAADYEVGSVVSGYGYRVKIYCNSCGEKEDISDVPFRDPANPR
jgi:hypothetical protein